MEPASPIASPAPEPSWLSGELLAFDLETTGVDPSRDVPVSFALVTTRGSRVVADDSSLVDPGRPIPAGASAVHGITSEQARAEGIPLGRAVAHLVERLVDASRRAVPVVGMKLDYDLTMVDRCHRRETGRGLEDEGFVGPVLDALVLDRHFDRYRKGRRTLVDLCAVYGVTMGSAHDATADATAALGVLAAMCERHPELAAAAPADLHRSQVGWHREWADSFSAWLEQRGRPPLRAEERTWPIAPVDAAGEGGTAAPSGTGARSPGSGAARPEAVAAR